MGEPINVCITGAAGQIGYSLLYSVCKGDVFGHQQKINLYLLDIVPMMGVLDGVRMEIEDCSLPLVSTITPTSDALIAFKDCDAAILVGAMPRREGMERKDLLAANVKIFKAQGEALNTAAKKTVKVVVIGNPANTNALICMKYANSIPKENFSALTRLDQNRAMAQISQRVGVSATDVSNVIIWGNHSSTQYPDVNHAVVVKDGKATPVKDAVKDDAWINNEFITCVQKRGGAVIAARKLSSAMSAAKAICDHMRDWWQGTPEGKWVSMGVVSDGSYGIEAGLMYSYPVKITNKTVSIVQGLAIDDVSREKMDLTAKELAEEKALAIEFCT